MRVLVSNIVLAEDIVRVLVAAEVLTRGALLEREREGKRELHLISILCVHYRSRVESSGQSVEYMTAESNDCILIAKPVGGRRERVAYTLPQSSPLTHTHTLAIISALGSPCLCLDNDSLTTLHIHICDLTLWCQLARPA